MKESKVLKPFGAETRANNVDEGVKSLEDKTLRKERAWEEISASETFSGLIWLDFRQTALHLSSLEI